MGDNQTDFSNMTYKQAYGNASIQSLPDLDNPCERIWSRYFSNHTTHKTWFTNNHHVEKVQMFRDCNKSVMDWQLGVKQIRYEDTS